MAGFKGCWEYSVDAKGRVALPAKLRRVVRPEANNAFTVTRGIDTCLYVYPAYIWEQIENQFRRLNPYRRDARNFMRVFLSWAEDVTLDSQGRIPLSKRLLEFSSITDKALIIGSLDVIEIWDPEEHAKHEKKLDIDYSELAESVMGSIQMSEPEE
jgi:MraZ protein